MIKISKIVITFYKNYTHSPAHLLFPLFKTKLSSFFNDIIQQLVPRKWLIDRRQSVTVTVDRCIGYFEQVRRSTTEDACGGTVFYIGRGDSTLSQSMAVMADRHFWEPSYQLTLCHWVIVASPVFKHTRFFSGVIWNAGFIWTTQRSCKNWDLLLKKRYAESMSLRKIKLWRTPKKCPTAYLKKDGVLHFWARQNVKEKEILKNSVVFYKLRYLLISFKIVAVSLQNICLVCFKIFSDSHCV